MRTLLAAILAAVTIVLPPLACPADLSQLPFSRQAVTNSDGTASVIAFKRAAADDPELSTQVQDIASSFGIVFIPGILGSALQDDKGVIWGQQNVADIARAGKY
jgi:hypothetical protein